MKRVFIDPQLLTKSWFQELGTSEKMAFVAILLLCDDVGVWHVNTKLVEFLVGSTVDWKRLEKCNGNLVPLREGVIWVPDYCRFQYKHIEANNNANESYRKLAEAHGLLGDIRATYRGSTLRLLLPNPSPTLDQGLTKGTSRVKDKEEDKDKDSYSTSPREEKSRETLGEVRYDLGDRVWYGISDEQVKEWSDAFPGVDVELQLRQMAGWCDANGAPEKPTAFIFKWLKGEVDKGKKGRVTR